MNERHFGAKLTSEGTTFRLWAPAAKRVDLLLEQHAIPLAPGKHGWFGTDGAGRQSRHALQVSHRR